MVDICEMGGEVEREAAEWCVFVMVSEMRCLKGVSKSKTSYTGELRIGRQ